MELTGKAIKNFGGKNYYSLTQIQTNDTYETIQQTI